MEFYDIRKIREEYPSLCYSCKYARRPSSRENILNGWVGCSILLNDFGARDISNDEELIEYVEKNGLDARAFGFGWVNLQSGIEFSKISWIMTNNQLIVNCVKKCGKYEIKK